MLSKLSSLRGSDLSRGWIQDKNTEGCPEDNHVPGQGNPWSTNYLEASFIQDIMGKEACGRKRAGGSFWGKSSPPCVDGIDDEFVSHFLPSSLLHDPIRTPVEGRGLMIEGGG